jgi:hypothetical protein
MSKFVNYRIESGADLAPKHPANRFKLHVYSEFALATPPRIPPAPATEQKKHQ